MSQSNYHYEIRVSFLGVLRAAWWSTEVRSRSNAHELEPLDRARFVLDSLGGQPLRAYRALHRRPGSSTERLTDALSGWMAATHLQAEWVARIALATLNLWSREPLALRRRVWRFPILAEYVPSEPLALSPDSWERRSESLAAWKRRTDKAFKEWLKQQVATYERERAAASYPPDPTIPRHYRRDLVWTVRAIVLDERWETIAKAKPRSGRDTVRHAVQSLAADLGLAVSDRPTGRPRRSTPSPKTRKKSRTRSIHL